MRRTVMLAGATVLAVAALSACASASDETASPSASSSASVVSTPAAVPDAESLAEALRDEIPEIGSDINSITVLEVTDDSDAYTSAAQLWDPRDHGSGEEANLDLEGAIVEVYANADAAQARSDQIWANVGRRVVPDGDEGPSGPGPEFHLLAGPALLRVSGNMPPEAYTQYRKAWEVVTAE